MITHICDKCHTHKGQFVTFPIKLGHCIFSNHGTDTMEIELCHLCASKFIQHLLIGNTEDSNRSILEVMDISY
jgi:hypothetical protein